MNNHIDCGFASLKMHKACEGKIEAQMVQCRREQRAQHLHRHSTQIYIENKNNKNQNKKLLNVTDRLLKA